MTLRQEYYLNYILSLYFTIYCVSLLIILLGTIFLKSRYKAESYNFLYTFNTLAAWSNLIVAFLFLRTLFLSWDGQNPYEWYAFSESGPYLSWRWIFIINIFSSVLGLLLFFRKLRINRLFTFLFLLSNGGFFYEKIVIFITSFYRDYLPSSWSTYLENAYPQNLYSISVIILLLVLTYLWAKKKGRLPFPSVFLK